MYPWLIHHFRVTMFTTQDRPVPGDLVEGLFESLTSLQPETDEWRGNKAFHRRSGNSSVQRFELTEQPHRLDFTMVGPSNLELASFDGTLEAAALSPLSDLDSFKLIADRIYANSEPPIRCAVAGLLYLPAISVHESYQHLKQLIPAMDLDYDHTSDFMLQINRFAASSVVEGLRLNRLAIFSSLSSGFVVMPQAQGPLATGGHWTQLVVDINTSQGNTTSFDKQIFDGLREEMFDAFRFVSQGVQ